MATQLADGGGRIGAKSDLPLRVTAAVAAIVAAAIHMALAVADLIPGEPTRGPVFGLLGLGYVLAAAAVLARRQIADGLVLLYAVGLVLAYATSRGELPVEPIGLATKTAEIIVVAICAVLLWRGREKTA